MTRARRRESNRIIFSDGELQADFKPGASLALLVGAGPDGNAMTYVRGKVLRFEPPKVFQYTFAMGQNDKVSRATIELVPDCFWQLPAAPLVTRHWRKVLCFRVMNAKGITPILNVSDIAASFAWFEKWGWRKLWDWTPPFGDAQGKPTFGAVGSGNCEIFLCQGGQGGRGRGANVATFGTDGDETADKGAWMSVWVENVDAIHKHCVEAGLDITFPPTDMPWNVREMHLRHPDGHVFRVSKGLGEE